MKTIRPFWSFLASWLMIIIAPCVAQDASWKAVQRGPRFAVLDLLIDSGGTPLGAWQVDIVAKRGNVKIVGVEGGEHPAFAEPAHYDPKALQRDHIRLAAFAVAKPQDLPSARTRVASIHIQIEGQTGPEFAVKLETAGDASGKVIPVQTQLVERESKP